MQCAIGDIQSIQFEILKVCRDICQRYGLTYFLFGDTLRGAVRGGAFLKNSTEAALLMPAGDLKNFCAYFEREAPQGMTLSNMHTEKEFPYLHAVVRKDGTKGVPGRLQNMPVHHGIGVTIYPYYPMEMRKTARTFTKMQIWLAEKMLGASLTPHIAKPSFLEKMILKIPAEKRRELAFVAVKKLEKGDKRSMQVCSPLGGANFFWRETLGEGETFALSLEGETFRVPDRKEVFLNMNGRERNDPLYGEMIWSLDAGKENGKGTKKKKKS